MWLLKTEPSEYGYDDLERAGRAVWDGVRNPVALRHLGAMKRGERAIVYHTGAEKAAVGLAEIVREAYPDPKAKDPRRIVVELAPRGRLKRAVTLAEIKALPVFKDSPLVRQGRLSVVPLSPVQWQAITGGGRRVSERIVVLSTVASAEDADRMARELVERRLAACVNVVPGLVSIYRWKGGVERDEERLLIIKTRSERFEALREALVALHPYEVPEVLALPIFAGSRPYLDWLDSAVAGRPD